MMAIVADEAGMRLFGFVSLVVVAGWLLSGCSVITDAGADEARELAVERMSTVPLPADYVLIEDESIVRDMDTNAFTRQPGSISDYWETDGLVEPGNFVRIDAALVEAGFRRYQQSSDSVCRERGVKIGYARREVDFVLSYGFATGKLKLRTNFSKESVDYNHLSNTLDWLDELPSCALEGTQ